MTGKTFKDRAELEAALKGHILAQSELMGRAYPAPPAFPA